MNKVYFYIDDGQLKNEHGEVVGVISNFSIDGDYREVYPGIIGDSRFILKITAAVWNRQLEPLEEDRKAKTATAVLIETKAIARDA